MTIAYELQIIERLERIEDSVKNIEETLSRSKTSLIKRNDECDVKGPRINALRYADRSAHINRAVRASYP